MDDFHEELIDHSNSLSETLAAIRKKKKSLELGMVNIAAIYINADGDRVW